MIDVILLEKIEKLGKIGDVVRVRPGYARNFLLPQNKALRATQANREVFEQKRTDIEAKHQDLHDKAETLRKKIDDKQIILIRAASESGQLYGSVTARDIAQAVQEQLQQSIDRAQIVREAPLKTLGIFPQKLRLHSDVEAVIALNIAKSQDEAVLQREAADKESLPSENETAPTAKPADASTPPPDAEPETFAEADSAEADEDRPLEENS